MKAEQSPTEHLKHGSYWCPRCALFAEAPEVRLARPSMVYWHRSGTVSHVLTRLMPWHPLPSRDGSPLAGVPGSDGSAEAPTAQTEVPQIDAAIAILHLHARRHRVADATETLAPASPRLRQLLDDAERENWIADVRGFELDELRWAITRLREQVS